MLVVLEGIDGAGKTTLRTALYALGRDVINTDFKLAFPRYADSIHAQLAAESLRGDIDHLFDPYTMATLFALDRHAVLDELQAAADSEQICILDRYIASNAAYTAARTDETALAWVQHLEYDRLNLPQPHLQILIHTDPELAERRVISREAQPHGQQRDRYETDHNLQIRTATMYQQLAQEQWCGRWMTVTDNDSIEEQAANILAALGKR